MTVLTAPAETASAADASALLALNRRRRRIRRWIFVGLAPFGLAGLLLVVKLLSMYAFAHESITSYVTDDYAGATSSAQGQEILNWFEPYKAPYNVGVGLAASEDLDAAKAKFEEALPLAHGLEVCAVRVNLSLVVERMGDAAVADGDGVQAAALYAQALQITADTPEECSSDEADEQSPDPNRSMKDTLDDQAERQQQKQQQQQQQNDGQGSDQGQDQDGSDDQQQQQQPDQSQLDELQDKLNQGTQERDQRDQGDDEGYGSGTDKPW